MSNKVKARRVRASIDEDGIIIFRLLQGRKTVRSMHVFGYGTRHKVWVRIDGMGTERMSSTVEPPEAAKEQIAAWVR